MKELSIEEKAKAYDEAIERAKKLQHDNAWVTSIFPELKESEDEKIRKALIELSKEVAQEQFFTNRGTNLQNVLAWLEKQGEQKVSVVEFNAQDWYVSKVDGKIYNAKFMEKTPTYQTRKLEIEKAAMSATGIIEQEEWFIKGAEWADENPSCVQIEKQGEPNDKAKVEHLIPQKGMYYTCIKDYYSSDNTHLCVKGNVYKSFFNGYIDDESHLGLSWTNSCTEKYFEPTKDEDWIVCEHDNVIGKPMQYKEFKKKVNQKFIENLKAKGLIPKLRLWNLQDANDGDVLVSTWKGHSYIYFFKEIESNAIMSYIYYYPELDTISDGTVAMVNTLTIPATKEQRDLLFSKMKEAGYEWDAEKKELKPIFDIEIPYGAKDSELQEVCYNIPEGFHADIEGNKVIIKKGEKKSNWSEEDEDMRYKATAVIHRLCAKGKEYVWSIKTLEKLFYWLKSLRPQNHWKPSEEQMETLWSATEKYLESDNENVRKLRGEVLESLYEDLKKLKN